MQMLIPLLFLGILLHDELGPATLKLPPGAALPAILWLFPTIIIFSYSLFCALTLRRLNAATGSKPIQFFTQFSNLYPLAIALHFFLSLYLGGLTWLRLDNHVGDLILIDELAFLVPSLLMLLAGWWVYYPIDRRLRNAINLARFNASLPALPIWTRNQYLLTQVRHQLALTGMPLILLLAWQETLVFCLPPEQTTSAANTRLLILLSGAAAVFLLTPIMIRHIWDTTPLPPSLLRTRLLALCSQYQVRIHELLLWKTFGGIVNAAVLGLFPRLRYILLTDALIESMSPIQIEAVMAHELAHIRKHHMAWMAVAAVASLEIFHLISSNTTDYFAQQLINPDAAAITSIALTLLAWLIIIGWVSRRFERQADTFAVQHLSLAKASRNAHTSSPTRIDADSVREMTQALQIVADLNSIPPRKWNWRHGSIRWRQNHLQKLIDQPAGRLLIDRQVNRIKLASLLGILVLIADFAISR